MGIGHHVAFPQQFLCIILNFSLKHVPIFCLNASAVQVSQGSVPGIGSIHVRNDFCIHIRAGAGESHLDILCQVNFLGFFQIFHGNFFGKSLQGNAHTA